MPACSSASREAATDIVWTVSSASAQRRVLDAGALLDPLVAGVDRLDDLGVGDHPARAGSAPMPRIAACGSAPTGRLLVGAVMRRLPRGAGGAAAGRGRPGRRPRRATRRLCRRAAAMTGDLVAPCWRRRRSRWPLVSALGAGRLPRRS